MVKMKSFGFVAFIVCFWSCNKLKAAKLIVVLSQMCSALKCLLWWLMVIVFANAFVFLSLLCPIALIRAILTHVALCRASIHEKCIHTVRRPIFFLCIIQEVYAVVSEN